MAVKEAGVALKAGNQLVDQQFRAEESQAARDIQAAGLAQKAEASQAKAAGAPPDQIAQIVAQAVQQAVAPLAQQMAQLLQLEQQEHSAGGPEQAPMPAVEEGAMQ